MTRDATPQSWAHVKAKIAAKLEFVQFLLAFPESADAHETLAEAYLADGQKDLARRHAEKAMAILESRTAPPSSWTDTERYRGQIRSGAQEVPKKLDVAH